MAPGDVLAVINFVNNHAADPPPGGEGEASRSESVLALGDSDLARQSLMAATLSPAGPFLAAPTTPLLQLAEKEAVQSLGSLARIERPAKNIGETPQENEAWMRRADFIAGPIAAAWLDSTAVTKATRASGRVANSSPAPVRIPPRPSPRSGRTMPSNPA